ncbi:MAG: AraC family transcriptional regulator [Desulfovibrio sp.]|jgi:AraC-like DNA-binding protein|nr:AraC family transcriptional regulator [Desulfovibrio sp.]
MLLEQIISYRQRGCISEIFLAAKKYELLYKLLELLGPDSASRQRVTSAERRAAYRAHRLLLQDVTAPPSLASLAASVGVNRGRLTRLFRHIYGETVFGILRRERLRLARNLLESDGKNITDIAYDCGFSSPGHFTKAFIARYGVPPKKFRQTTRA